eukprot:UN21268
MVRRNFPLSAFEPCILVEIPYFQNQMKLNVNISIFWAFGLISVLRRSISFYRSNGTAEPDQSILISIYHKMFLGAEPPG